MRLLIIVVTYLFAVAFTGATIYLLLTIIMPFTVRVERKTHTSANHRGAVVGAAAGTAAVAVGCFSVLLSGVLPADTPKQSPPQKTADTRPSLVASTIAFDQPRAGEQVKQCPTIEGTGKIPADKGLWVVVVANSAERPKQYWMESPAEMDGPDHWSTSHAVSVGTPEMSNISSEIYAVLIQKSWSDFLTKSTAAGNFSAQGLPPTADVVAGPVPVTRIAEPGSQSCHQ